MSSSFVLKLENTASRRKERVKKICKNDWLIFKLSKSRTETRKGFGRRTAGECQRNAPHLIGYWYVRTSLMFYYYIHSTLQRRNIFFKKMSNAVYRRTGTYLLHALLYLITGMHHHVQEFSLVYTYIHSHRTLLFS